MNKLKELNTTNLKRIKDANPANIYRAAERCGIEDPKEISSKELYLRYKTCKEQTRRLMAQSPWMRKRFLSERLTDLIDRKKTEEAKKIKDVLISEAHRKQWQGVHQVINQEKAGMIT